VMSRFVVMSRSVVPQSRKSKHGSRSSEVQAGARAPDIFSW